MSISFKRSTVTVLRASEIPDGRGGVRRDWENPQTFEIHQCIVQPLAGSRTGGESTGGRRDSIEARWRLSGPIDADVMDRDRIRHQGVTYEIDGPVLRYESPSGRLNHFDATLKHVDG